MPTLPDVQKEREYKQIHDTIQWHFARCLSLTDHAVLCYADRLKTRHLIGSCVVGTVAGATLGGRRRLAALVRHAWAPPPLAPGVDRIATRLRGAKKAVLAHGGSEEGDWFLGWSVLGLLAGAQLGGSLGQRAARDHIASSGRQESIVQGFHRTLKRAAVDLPATIARSHPTFSHPTHLPGLTVDPPAGLIFRGEGNQATSRMYNTPLGSRIFGMVPHRDRGGSGTRPPPGDGAGGEGLGEASRWRVDLDALFARDRQRW